MNYRNIEANIAYHTFLKYHLLIYNLPESVSIKDTFKVTISVPSYLLGVFYEEVMRRPKPSCSRYYNEYVGEYCVKQTNKDEITIKHESLDFISSIEDVSMYKNVLNDVPPRKYLFSYSDGIETMKIPIDDLRNANELMTFFLKQNIIQNNENVKWVDSFHPSFPSLGHGLYFEDNQGKLHLLWKNGESKAVFQNIEMFYERNGMFVEFMEDAPEFAF